MLIHHVTGQSEIQQGYFSLMLQAISFSIAESLKKDVVPKRKYYIMVKLFEKLPKLAEQKKPIGNTF